MAVFQVSKGNELRVNLLYIFLDVGIDFIVQGLQHIRVDGQVVQRVDQSGGGGLIATEDEDQGLGKNLMFCQTYRNDKRNLAETF